jgi:RNA polymerase sigma factor (sigma-70 family)
MTVALSVPGPAARASTVDHRLVRDCLNGSEDAWAALIEKYKSLIFSIPVKYGLARDDATDIFQAVCLEMLTELRNLREPRALPKWLMQVTSHKCLRWKQQMGRMVSTESEEAQSPEEEKPARLEEILHEAEQEQMLREAVNSLAPRCRELIRMLFYEEPVRPYQQIAASLGLATGSIGFIRQRCLDRLRARLNDLGFQ